jgi:hypothetical protein
MQIQPEFQTVGQLLNGRLFKIPENQRAYSWGKKQGEDLFRDIHKARQGVDHLMATMVGLHRGVVTKDAVDGSGRASAIPDARKSFVTSCLDMRSTSPKRQGRNSTSLSGRRSGSRNRQSPSNTSRRKVPAPATFIG